MISRNRNRNIKREPDEFNYQLVTEVVKRGSYHYVECSLNIRNRSIAMNKMVEVFEYEAKGDCGTPKYTSGWETLYKYSRESESVEDLVTTIIIRELKMREEEKKESEEVREIIKGLNKRGTITIKRR